MGRPLQVAVLPIIFGDKCCACLRLQQRSTESRDGGAGDRRVEIEGGEPQGCSQGWIVYLTSLELAGWLDVTHTI